MNCFKKSGSESREMNNRLFVLYAHLFYNFSSLTAHFVFDFFNMLSVKVMTEEEKIHERGTWDQVQNNARK